MNAGRVHEQRLRSLDFWQGPVAVEPIPGGITNHNYRVLSAQGTFVARLCPELPLLGIDRRNEVVCQREAHALGVAPEVVHHEDGVLVSAFVQGRTLTPEEIRRPEVLPRLAARLRTLHDGWNALTGEILYFSAFQTVRTYARTARQLNARLPDDIDALLLDARDLSGRITPFVPVLCHNDMLAANVLDDGENVWIVDWEYAGMGHPLFDLAGVSANNGLSEPEEVALLIAYRGRLDPRDLTELRVLKTMSQLREALWSLIQTVASDIAFDYHAYAETNFQAYREARGRLVLP